jgi:hypothetical protein
MWLWLINVLWHVDQLLGNEREGDNWTTTVTRQRPAICDGVAVFSMRSVSRRAKHDNSVEIV